MQKKYLNMNKIIISGPFFKMFSAIFQPFNNIRIMLSLNIIMNEKEIVQYYLQLMYSVGDADNP